MECGLVAAGEQARLFDPVVAAYAAGKVAKLLVERIDIALAPGSDLRKLRDTEFAQPRCELGSDPLQAGEIVDFAGTAGQGNMCCPMLHLCTNSRKPFRRGYRRCR